MTSEYGVFYGDSLYDYNVKKVPLIEYILYEGDVICISARAGTGKSILALQLIFNLTTAQPFLDTYSISRPCNVLYIQTEGDRAETLERIANMKKGLKINDSRWVHMNQAGIVINSQLGIEQVVKLAKEPKMMYDVIIIDPLYTTVKGTLISDEVATDWVRNARKLKGLFNCAMIILHHEHKDMYVQGQIVERETDNVIGSTFWNAFFNQNFKFKRIENIYHFQRGKQRSGKIIDHLEMKLIEPAPLMFVNAEEFTDSSSSKVKRTLMTIKKRMTAKEISQDCELSLATAYRAINRLIGNGIIEHIVEDGIGYYILKENK